MKRATTNEDMKYTCPFDYKNLVPEFEFLADGGNVIEKRLDDTHHLVTFIRNGTVWKLNYSLGYHGVTITPLEILDGKEQLKELFKIEKDFCQDDENEDILYTACIERPNNGLASLHLKFYWNPAIV